MDPIASALERLESALLRRSDFGVGTARSVTTLTAGLRCSTEERSWITDSDLAPALGGEGSAPSPGTLLRAAFGSCVAMSYRLRAARHQIELTSIRVTVEADSEIAGMLVPGAACPPGYSELRYHVEVESPAAHDDVLRVLDEGDRLGPLLDVFTRAQTVRRTVAIRRGEAVR